MFKKRIRASNFNGAEEDTLIQCILRHATIIENKKTDACTLREKQRAWDKIENEFNSLCPNVARKSKALKDKYTNIKTILRKQFAAEKKSQKAIGGGKEIPEWRSRSEAMAELANFLSISKYTPMTVRKPNSSQLKFPTSAASSSQSDKEDSLLGLKKKLIERELEMHEIEHQARLRQQQTEHEARMTLLEAQTIDFKTKIELRNLKIAKFRNDQHYKTDVDSE